MKYNYNQTRGFQDILRKTIEGYFNSLDYFTLKKHFPNKVFLYSDRNTIKLLFVWLFTSHQQSFSYVGTGPPGLNQY